MNKKEFIEELEKINIYLTKKQLEQLDEYYKILIEWNKKTNLTRIVEEKDVYLKHFYDSLTLSKIVNLDSDLSICDLGSGAGFPGIVIKIVFPKTNITLVDSLNKRIIFLDYVINSLKLEKIKSIHSRIEDYALKNIEKYDIVTARAVAQLNTLLEYGSQLVKVNGNFIAMKGNISQEIKNSEKAIKLLNFKMSEIMEFKLPYENSDRTLIRLLKEKETPKIYPRKNEIIKKTPL